MSTKNQLKKQALDNIQREWEENIEEHTAQRENPQGIVSSQISALVTYLVDIGVITDDNVNNQTIV